MYHLTYRDPRDGRGQRLWICNFIANSAVALRIASHLCSSHSLCRAVDPPVSTQQHVYTVEAGMNLVVRFLVMSHAFHSIESTFVVGWYWQRECDTTPCMDLASLVMCLSFVLCTDINIGWRYWHHDAKEHELELFSSVSICG